eukprot:4820930-Ditylum_brightwellii.AAC.1
MKDRGNDFAFNSGAAGYILSRVTMKRLGKKWSEKDPECTAENAPAFIQGNPGLVTARCLSHILHVSALDTRDEYGRHRFHAFGLVRVIAGKVDDWYNKKHETLDGVLGVDNVHHHKLQSGTLCCAPRTVSFHYVEGSETRSLFEVRKRLKEEPTISDDELKKFMQKVWPAERKEIGFYAHGLPNDDSTSWENILQVMRMISSNEHNDGLDNMAGVHC